jgi:putative DNA primase/helicase
MVIANLADPAIRAAVLDREKDVIRIRAEAKRAVSAERTGPVPDLLALSLAELATHQFPARRPLLYRGDSVVFREGHIGQIYAERGFGKSWLMQTIALVAAYGIDALGFHNPTPCRVLQVDGEMASEELQERSANLCRMLNVPSYTTGALTIIAADWQDTYLPRLDTLEGQEAIEPYVEAADFILFDNRSCLFDPEGEKDPTAWQPAQDYLLSLRRRGKAVMLAHHSNRMGGARGISKAEDPMNLLLKLTRPEDYSQDQGARFLVTFDKARGVYGAAAAPFIAALTQSGWLVEPAEAEEDSAAKKLRDYLLLANTVNERPKSASAAVSAAHVNRNKGFEAWAAMLKRGEVAEHADGGFYVVEVPCEL